MWKAGWVKRSPGCWGRALPPVRWMFDFYCAVSGGQRNQGNQPNGGAQAAIPPPPPPQYRYALPSVVTPEFGHACVCDRMK